MSNIPELHIKLKTKGRGAKDWANSWTEVEYLGEGKFAANISVGHRVFKDKIDGQWKKHKLTDERPAKDYVLVQGAKCCVEVYPYYAKYFDVHHEEVRLYEERWVVQRLRQPQGDWRDVGAWNPVMTTEEGADLIKVSITYDTDYGPLVLEYIQRDGRDLKHYLHFINTQSPLETFRVQSRWAGIVGSKVSGKNVPMIFSPVEDYYLEFHDADKPRKEFNISENLWSMVFNPDGSEKTEHRLQGPFHVESHAQGMKMDLTYGDWVLAQGESLEIDPATATLDNPTVDGLASYDEDDDRDYELNTVRNTNDYGKDTNWVYERLTAFFEWSLLGLPDAISVSNSDFRYHCLRREQWGNIYEMTSKPSTSSAETIYNDAIGGTLYVSAASETFPIEGTNKQIDLGGSADDLIESRVASGDWFAIGLSPSVFTHQLVTWMVSDDYSSPNPVPTLYIVYTVVVDPPTVTTQAATNIVSENGTYSVTLHGTIVDTGGENCDRRGFEWGSSSGVYTQGYLYPGSFGTGPFDHHQHFTGTIYYRAQARNSAGYGYGGERTIDPPVEPPDPPTNVQASDGTYTDKVVITWTKSDDAIEYQVYRNGTPLGWVGDVATFNDFGAGAPTITHGIALASDGTFEDRIWVYVSGAGTSNGTVHTYKVKARGAGGDSGDSGTNTGYRGPGSLNYQWYRSSGDSDAGYSYLPGATSSSYNDYGAPSNGDGRYYKCYLVASGCSSVYSDPDRGYRSLPPVDPPTNVQASDGTYTNRVLITWTKSSGATGYQVYRNGVPLGWLGDVATFNDYGASAPYITPGSAVASDGSHTGYISVYISGYSVNNGTVHTYKVKARNGGGESGYSGTNTGYRGHGAAQYQWYRSAGDSDGSYSALSGATSSTHSDYTAPAPTITHGTCSASDGTYSTYVRLINSGASTNVGAGRYYKRYVMADGCSPQYSGSNRGYRGVGSLTYQWYKSAGDSNASYSSISGATSSTYNYTGAPAPTITPGTTSASDGTYIDYVRLTLSGESTNNGAGRYYKCYHTATGASSGYTGYNRGYRGVGALTHQWRRSAADSDTSYSNIDGATYEPYNDTGAPANGDGRWYYCRLNATGATLQDSTHNRGYRDVGITAVTMIGGPIGWTWGTPESGVSVVRITTDGGQTWVWVTATGTITIPDGDPTGWTWEEVAF